MGLSEAFQRGGVGGLFQPSGARLLVFGWVVDGVTIPRLIWVPVEPRDLGRRKSSV